MDSNTHASLERRNRPGANAVVTGARRVYRPPDAPHHTQPLRALAQRLNDSAGVQAQKALQHSLNHGPGVVAQRRLAGILSDRKRLPALEQRQHPSRKQPGHESALVPGERSTLQMKMKVAQTGDVFAAVNAASTKLSVDCAPLARPIGAQDQYTVKAEDDLKALARGNEADVLMPSKHVIGEVHTASEFDRITGEWPGITAMGEGHYTVKETGLDLPATRGDGHANFEHVMRALGSPVLPLDNYHAAAIARLTGFLVIWNEYEHNRSTIVEGHLRRRVSDLLDAIFVYSSVSTEVYNKGNQNRRFWQRSPRYRGDIEKAYGSMDGVLTTANARVAVAHLKRIVAAIGSGGRIPAMSGKDFASVRNLLGEMVPSIANILSISAKGEAAGAQVATGAGTAAMYVKRNLGTLRERDMPTALSQIGPTRERLMKQQIDSIPKPALIKVGRAHIPGLASLSISDVTLYDDASDFDTALPKSADDL